MHFTIDRTAFLNELNHLQGVAGAKQVIPILSHLLIETRADRITMRATDLDLTITTGCEARVREDRGRVRHSPDSMGGGFLSAGESTGYVFAIRTTSGNL